MWPRGSLKILVTSSLFDKNPCTFESLLNSRQNPCDLESLSKYTFNVPKMHRDTHEVRPRFDDLTKSVFFGVPIPLFWFLKKRVRKFQPTGIRTDPDLTIWRKVVFLAYRYVSFLFLVKLAARCDSQKNMEFDQKKYWIANQNHGFGSTLYATARLKLPYWVRGLRYPPHSNIHIYLSLSLYLSIYVYMHVIIHLCI